MLNEKDERERERKDKQQLVVRRRDQVGWKRRTMLQTSLGEQVNRFDVGLDKQSRGKGEMKC